MATRQLARRWAVACVPFSLAVTLAWSLPGAVQAAPKPTKAQVQAQLNKLNHKVDLLVDKLNKANGELKIAKRKMETADRAAKRENANFDKARLSIVQMAQEAYKTGDMNVAALVSSGDPQKLLDQVSVFSQVSTSRSDKIREFLNAVQRREREKGRAKDSLATVQAKVKEIRDQKSEIDAEVVEQKKLLRKLGVDPDKPKTGPIGGNYTGPASGAPRKALDYAYAQKGKPYVYGGDGPNGFDCSGLTMMAWRAAGVSLPHNAAAQYSATADKRIAYEDLQPGDLVFFRQLGHVGLYVGNGQMIHAPSTGDVVRVVSITSGYYRANYYGAGRP